MRKLLVTAMVVLILSSLAGAADLNLRGHNNPVPSRPEFRSAGEGFAPLPLPGPATPVRRSEKKREPAPPILIAKIGYVPHMYGVTNDVRNLLRWLGQQIDLQYRAVDFHWADFSYDATEVPILYLSGHDAVPTLAATDMARLRSYLYNGGTLLANACCGDETFTRSFRRFAAALFPDRPLRPLSVEHPAYWCFVKAAAVHYQEGTDRFREGPPRLEGVDLGCRTVVIFAPTDLSNGWYGQMPPEGFAAGHWVLREDARRLGVNIMTYILANQQYARSFPLTQMEFRQAKSVGQALSIGRLIHGGDWDPNPSALPRLQKYLAEHSTLEVDFKRTAVDPADAAVFQFPVLYIVGHEDFVLSDEQVANLRQYLAQGGVLVAEACCGRKEFDLAFRREIKRVLPEAGLELLPVDHELRTIVFKVRAVDLSPLARTGYPKLETAWLETVTVAGRPVVIYSPLALANGWEGIDHPFSAGYSHVDASRLGVNIFVYVMSH